MKNYESYQDFKHDVENVWSIISKSKINPGFSLPLDNDEDQFKTLAESLLYVSEKRTVYMKRLNEYLNSTAFKKEYFSRFRESLKIQRLRILSDALIELKYDHVDLSDKYEQEWHEMLKQAQHFKDEGLVDDYQAFIESKINEIENSWNLVEETNDELLSVIFYLFRHVLDGFFGFDSMINDEDTLQEMISKIQKIDLSGSYLPFAMRPFFINELMLFSNAPYEYFPFDLESGEYFKKNLTGFLQESMLEVAQFPFSAIAELVDEKKLELSDEFYKECKLHLYTISQVQRCNRTNNKNNIDITNALNICYEIIKGYKKSGSIFYTKTDSPRDVISRLAGNVDYDIQYPNTDASFHEFYKMFIIKDGDGKITGDPLRSNNYSYGEIIEEIKLELQKDLIDDESICYTGRSFLEILEGDIFYNLEDSVDTARRHLAKILFDDIFFELNKLNKDELATLNKWLRFELIELHEPEIASYESVRINKIKKQANISLIKSAIDKLHSFEAIENKLKKAKKRFKEFFEENEDNLGLQSQATWNPSIIDVPEFYNTFHKTFSKKMRKFGRSFDFFFDKFVDETDPERSSDFFEPYAEKNVKKLKKILSPFLENLILKDKNANSKKNLQIANKNLNEQDKKFLQDWLIAEQQLIYIDYALRDIDYAKAIDDGKNILPKGKYKDIYGNMLIIEFPNYKKIHLSSSNFFKSTKDYYKTDEDGNISNKKINKIKNLIERLLELIQAQPKVAGQLLKHLKQVSTGKQLKEKDSKNENEEINDIDKRVYEHTDVDSSLEGMKDVLDVFRTYILFKTRTLCELCVAESIDPVIRTILFLNGINPINQWEVQNTYDILRKDLNKSIKLFQAYFEYLKVSQWDHEEEMLFWNARKTDEEVTILDQSELMSMNKNQILEKANELKFTSVNLSQKKAKMIESYITESEEFINSCKSWELPPPVTKSLVVWEIIDSLQDLQKHLTMMESFDIHDLESEFKGYMHEHLEFQQRLLIRNAKKQKGMSDHELTVLAKKIRKYKADCPSSIKKAIDKYACNQSNNTKFIRDQRDMLRKPIRDKYRASKKLYKTGKINLEQLNEAKAKFEQDIKKIESKKKRSLLHNKTKYGGVDRDSAVKWLQNRPGNLSKLKDLYHYPDLLHNIDFYEFNEICEGRKPNIF